MYKLISKAGIHELWVTSHSAGYLTADTSLLLMTVIPEAQQKQLNRIQPTKYEDIFRDVLTVNY